MPKKSGRRLLSGLLALVLCLTLVPVLYADTVVSVESWHDAEDFEEKVDEWKAGLDAETRRAVRPYWIAITAIGFVLGCGVGHLFF